MVSLILSDHEIISRATESAKGCLQLYLKTNQVTFAVANDGLWIRYASLVGLRAQKIPLLVRIYELIVYFSKQIPRLLAV